MVVTQREINDFKVELNKILAGIDERLKALEEATEAKTATRKKVVDKSE